MRDNLKLTQDKIITPTYSFLKLSLYLELRNTTYLKKMLRNIPINLIYASVMNIHETVGTWV